MIRFAASLIAYFYTAEDALAHSEDLVVNRQFSIRNGKISFHRTSDVMCVLGTAHGNEKVRHSTFIFSMVTAGRELFVHNAVMETGHGW
jgi:hypothetical protein